jgi:DNA-binding LacI/PurR family transcriptional regulator
MKAELSLSSLRSCAVRVHSVARPTRERVQAAICDLGYAVNELARQIGTGRRPYISILAIKVATTPYA